MPKTRYTAKRPTTYAPRRRATVKKPYTNSRYGNDAYVKVEAIEPLATAANSANVFATMRVNDPINSPGNQYLGN